MIKEVRFAPDSALKEGGFEPVWGLSCQVVVFGLLAVLCSEVCPGKPSMFSRRQFWRQMPTTCGRGTESLQTHRRRKGDSNSPSHPERERSEERHMGPRTAPGFGVAP